MIFLSNKELTKKIKDLLKDGGYAVVAYLGKNARNIIPKNTTVICNFNSMGTNPHEIQWLLEHKVDVRNLDNLHAKVYCSRYGAIVCSANLSTNGLELLEGKHANMCEAGVYIPAKGKNSVKQRAYKDILQWCVRKEKDAKKGNISVSDIETRISEWDKIKSGFRRNRNEEALNLQAYAEFRDNILIVPITGDSDVWS